MGRQRPADRTHPDRRQVALIDDHRWGLRSPELAERRAAVRELLRRPLASRRFLTLLRDRLLTDPDPQIRLDALEALRRHRRSVSPRSLRPALTDPVGEVRDRVVRMLAELGELTANDLSRTERDRSGVDPRTVLRVLVDAAEQGPVDDGCLHLALSAVAALPPTVRVHSPDLVRLARAIGPDRLIVALDADDDSRPGNADHNSRLGDADHSSRLGAARLLLADERPRALAAVAELGGDEPEEVRVVAALARSLLTGVPRSPEGPAPERPVRSPDRPSPGGAEHRPRPDGGLASRELLSLLRDPAPSVRRAAAIDLLRTGSSASVRHVVRSLPPDELVAALRGVMTVDGEGAIGRLVDLLATDTENEHLEPALRSLLAEERSPNPPRPPAPRTDPGGPGVRAHLRSAPEPPRRRRPDDRRTGR